MTVGDVAASAWGDGGPASLVVADLPTDATLAIEVDGRPAGRVTTLRAPDGPERCRVAVLSDLHVGEPSFGFWPAIAHPDPDDPPNERSLRTALADALAWGAEAIVLKGDLTDTGQAAQFETLAAIVDGLGVPVLATLGNHDVKPGSVDGREILAAAGVEMVVAGTRILDRPGLRVVVADVTVDGRHHGSVAEVADDVVAAATGAAAGVLVAFHHHIHVTPVGAYWPPGMWGQPVRELLDRLTEANPRTLVTTGHTHRHRRRDHGPVAITETGSPKDGPGTWTGYVVHDGGIRQVVRRVTGRDELRWTDSTNKVFLGMWGHWSPGRLTDRCFVQRWD